MQGSQTQSDVHLLLCQKHRQDKSFAPYLLSVQQVWIDLYLHGDHGNHIWINWRVYAFWNFWVQKGKGPTHSVDAVIVASADTCLRYGHPGERPVGKEFLALSMTVLTHISSSMFKVVDCSWSHVWTLWLQKQCAWSCKPSTKAHWTRRPSSDILLMRLWYQRTCCHQWKCKG